MFDLTGKTAIVTGGGSGIGESISTILAQAGCQVALVDLNEENGAAVTQRITETGGKCTFHPCDVAEESDFSAVAEAVYAVNDSIDILVNNAGIAHIGNIEETTVQDLERVFRVNVQGVFIGMKSVIPYMKQTGGGSIINMASVAASVAVADRFAYGTSKGAVRIMTFSVAKDYLADNIRCNCISPARIHTPFVDGYLSENYPGREQEMFEKLAATQPIGRMGTPDEVGYMVAYLASDEAAFITGTDLPLDGGYLNLNP